MKKAILIISCILTFSFVSCTNTKYVKTDYQKKSKGNSVFIINKLNCEIVGYEVTKLNSDNFNKKKNEFDNIIIKTDNIPLQKHENFKPIEIVSGGYFEVPIDKTYYYQVVILDENGHNYYLFIEGNRLTSEKNAVVLRDINYKAKQRGDFVAKFFGK